MYRGSRKSFTWQRQRKDPRNQPLCLVKRVYLIFPNHAKFGLLEASFLIWAIPYRIAAVTFCSILPRKQKLVNLLGLPFKSSPFGAFKKFRSRWIFSCFENCLASTFSPTSASNCRARDTALDTWELVKVGCQANTMGWSLDQGKYL